MSSAFAGPVLSAGIADCTKPKDLTGTQQFIKGLIGVGPDNEWTVVIGSFATSDNSIEAMEGLNQRYAGRYTAKACAPTPDSGGRFRVIIGEHLSHSDAQALRRKAISDGVSENAWAVVLNQLTEYSSANTLA